MALTAAAQAQVTEKAMPETPAKPLSIDSTATGPVLTISTTMGDVKIRLYDDTPLHRDNFLKLVGENYYDSVLFHRVIRDFMVQTGDPDSKNAKPGQHLGAGSPDYTIPAEIRPNHVHKYGALAAARTGDNVNPERRSSASQFYIVTGNVYSERQLRSMAERMADQERQMYFQNLVREHGADIRAMQEAKDSVGLENLRQKLIAQTMANVQPTTYTDEVLKVYSTSGGSPHLDGQYTVFGEVIDGMDVIEKIQAVKTDGMDRPVEDVRVLGIKREQ